MYVQYVGVGRVCSALFACVLSVLRCVKMHLAILATLKLKDKKLLLSNILIVAALGSAITVSGWQLALNDS